MMWPAVAAILAVIACCQAAEIFHMTVVPPPSSASNDSSFIEQPASIDHSVIGHEASHSSRVVGGQATTIEKYPFVVQVLKQCSYHCAGTLLSNQHVLTAAECVFKKEPSLFSVRVGTELVNAGGTVHAVSKIIAHEKYSEAESGENNVALMLLATKVTLDSKAAIGTLPIKDFTVPQQVHVSSTCTCASALFGVGWGSTNESVLEPAPVLMVVEMPKVSVEDCGELYGKVKSITANMICAGVVDGGKGLCNNDSGAPLIFKDHTDETSLVVGITSLVSCGKPKYPSVFTKVSKYTVWINTTMKALGSARVLRTGGSLTGAAAAGAPAAGLALLAPLLILRLA